MKTQTKTAVAQAPNTGQVFYLNFQEIPEPTITLGEKGRLEYEQWCRDYISNGSLTRESKADIESYAASVDMLEKAIATGKNFRAAAELRRNALKSLKKFNAETSNVAPQRGENAYSAFGFAKRSRSRRTGED